MDSLSNREKKLIQYLNEAEDLITSKNLADKLGVSTRTIKNDIKIINQKMLDKMIIIHTKQGRGIWIEIPEEQKNLINSLSINQGKQINQDEKEKRKYIIIYFLLKQKDYISIDNIAYDIYLSRSSIINEFKDILNIIENYGCEFIRNNFGVLLKGSEQKLRGIQVYIFNQLNLFKKHNSQINTIYKKVESLILNIENTFIIRLSDKEYQNLSQYLTVLIYRYQNDLIRNNKLIYHKKSSSIHNTFCEYLLCKLENDFLLHCYDFETSLLNQFLSGMHINITSIQNETIKETKLREILYSVLKDIDSIYLTHLHKDKLLMNNLVKHLIPAINRAKYQIHYENPLLNHLKKELTFDYEISLEISQELDEKFNVHLNEDEIGLLTMHIATSLEKNRMNCQRFNVNIISSDGEGIREYTKVRIESLFKEININKIISSRDFSLKDITNIDFLISTVPLKDCSIPIIFISSLVKDEDIIKIRKCIFQIESDKRKKVKEIIKYFDPGISLFQQDIKDRENAIFCIANLMKDRKYCSEDTIASALEREKISSTALGNFIAIPHPFPKSIIKNKVGVLILKNKIEWLDQEVQIIFFICIKPNDGIKLTKVMQELFNITSNIELIQKLRQVSTYQQFINLIESDPLK